MTLEDYLKENPKKVLIFDFDETLVQLILPWSKLTNQLRKIGARVDRGFTQKIRRIDSLSNLANLLVSRYGPGWWIIVTKLWENFEKRNLRGYNPNPELIEFIKENRNNYTFYIWSSNTSYTVERILLELGIKDMFVKIITKDRVKYIKPFPDGFYEIYKEGDDRSDFLMIGDSRRNDGEASKRAGIDYFPVNYF